MRAIHRGWRWIGLWGAAAVSALLLASCGGGDVAPPVTTSSVKVVGDSLNDSGTFGFKFTVQGYPIWTERVASAVGAPALCSRYLAQSASVVALNPAATACTSYGVGGARINPKDPVSDNSPFSVVQQLATLASEKPFSPDELLLVDGGGNDVADLAEAYLSDLNNLVAFDTLLGELAVNRVGPGGVDAAGAVYMQALADRLADAVTTHALNRDAQRVVVLTAPDVTVTPQFLAVLAAVSAQAAAANPGDPTAGPVAAAQVKALVSGWVQAFNAGLRSRLGNHPRVAIVDFNTELNQWVATPATYGLTDVDTPACPGDISLCTEAVLGPVPYPGWWTGYLFSDDFHGTPRTNELMAQAVTRALEAKGWK